MEYSLYLEHDDYVDVRSDIRNLDKIILDNINSPYDRNSILLIKFNELLEELLVEFKGLSNKLMKYT